MSQLRSTAVVTLVLLGMLGLPAVRAEPGAEGDRIIARMDRRMSNAEDQSFRYAMTTRIQGQQDRRIEFTVQIKGDQWRRLEFHSPGDVRGMRVLILSQSKMYIYLPAFRKVRRVATHVRDQGFMGSAYSHDDMSAVTYGDKMTGKLLDESDTHWTVEATRRPGSGYRYARIVFEILKDVQQPSRIEYFNDEGRKVKSETRRVYECRGEFCNAREMTLTDHTRNDLSSTLTRLDWQVNTGLSDAHFTVRSLQRRR